MKKTIKLVWMMLFALPFVAFTSCSDDDDLEDNNTGTKVELKDYSDLIGKKYNDVIKKMGGNYDTEASNQFQLVYINPDDNVTYLDALYTFYDEGTDGNYYPNSTTPYEKCVQVDVNVKGFDGTYLINRLQDFYGKTQFDTDEEGTYAFWDKDGKYIIYEFVNGEGEITYIDKKEFDKAYPDDAANFQAVKTYVQKTQKRIDNLQYSTVK